MIYSPLEFSEKLKELIAVEKIAMTTGLEVVAISIEEEAKKEIGKYQEQKGSFPEWQELAESTIKEKERLGYGPPDNPLLRTGEMRDSIKHEVMGHEAIIGSNSPIIGYHEYGTSKMPARPVIGPAAFSKKRFIGRCIGAYVVSGFLGEGERLHSAISTKFKEDE